MKQDAGRKKLGELAPKFAELNDDILFGEVWSRTAELSERDRCIVTVSSLVSRGIIDDSLKYHLLNAKRHGVTKTEMAEIATHLAFYAGWPRAWALFPLIREAYEGEEDPIPGESLFGMGEINPYAQYFVGSSYLKELNAKGVPIFNVTFEPRCRNNWHIHHGGGQILLCTNGEGWYQEEGKRARKLKPGDVVYIGPGIKHWHGASKDSWFSHVAIEVPADSSSTEWCEEVSDVEYEEL